MSDAALVNPDVSTETLPKKRFTRAEVELMLGAGVFEGRRFELIDGELIDKKGQKPPHSYAIRQLSIWLVGLFGIERLQIQLPMEAAPGDRDKSWPEPDLAVL